jgi:hypothetical protein
MSNGLMLGARSRRSISRAARDPDGRWGLTAQRGQAEASCHVMNAGRPHQEGGVQPIDNIVHSAAGEDTVENPQDSHRLSETGIPNLEN